MGPMYQLDNYQVCVMQGRSRWLQVGRSPCVGDWLRARAGGDDKEFASECIALVCTAEPCACILVIAFVFLAVRRVYWL